MAGKLRFFGSDLRIIAEKFDVKDICFTDHLRNQYSIDVSGALKLKFTPSGGDSEEYTLAELSNWIRDLFKVREDNTPTLPKSFIHTSDITSWWNNAFNNFASTQYYKDKNYTEWKREALQLIGRDLLECIRSQECDPSFNKRKNIDENNITIENFIKEIEESYGLRFCAHHIDSKWNDESKQSLYTKYTDRMDIILKKDENEAKSWKYYIFPKKNPIQEIIRIKDLADVIGDVLREESRKEIIIPIGSTFAKLDGSNITDDISNKLMCHHTAQICDFLSELDTQYNVFGIED
ncbi:Hypothetical protein CINCED_3A004634 [Cinara cedri]|uniref:Uncharacterized protein n=1 Tax=Cinara cedri TaxID=506608 RepID=A0A5E4MX65_9HEMI|nr:Hypothetical protein CINCED_3A004634 [Cinara cedri]